MTKRKTKEEIEAALCGLFLTNAAYTDTGLSEQQRIERVEAFISGVLGGYSDEEIARLHVKNPAIIKKKTIKNYAPITQVLADFILHTHATSSDADYPVMTPNNELQTAWRDARRTENETDFKAKAGLGDDGSGNLDEAIVKLQPNYYRHLQDEQTSLLDSQLGVSENYEVDYGEMLDLVAKVSENPDKAAEELYNKHRSRMVRQYKEQFDFKGDRAGFKDKVVKHIARKIKKLAAERVKICLVCENAFYALDTRREVCTNESDLSRLGYIPTQATYYKNSDSGEDQKKVKHNGWRLQASKSCGGVFTTFSPEEKEFKRKKIRSLMELGNGKNIS